MRGWDVPTPLSTALSTDGGIAISDRDTLNADTNSWTFLLAKSRSIFLFMLFQFLFHLNINQRGFIAAMFLRSCVA